MQVMRVILSNLISTGYELNVPMLIKSIAGHSQGGAILAVLLSERPEYNDKISLTHLIAPAIIMKHYNILLKPALNNVYQLKVSKTHLNYIFLV